MAYENTEVGVPKSQDQIRNLIYAHAGTGLMLISRPPHEGFEAMVTLNKLSYHIRVMAIAMEIKSFDTAGRNRSKKIIEDLTAKENRRVWRVLYWHLKAMFGGCGLWGYRHSRCHHALCCSPRRTHPFGSCEA